MADGKPQAGGERWAPAAQLALTQPSGSNMLGSICIAVWCGDTLSDRQTLPVFWESSQRSGAQGREQCHGRDPGCGLCTKESARRL